MRYNLIEGDIDLELTVSLPLIPLVPQGVRSLWQREPPRPRNFPVDHKPQHEGHIALEGLVRRPSSALPVVPPGSDPPLGRLADARQVDPLLHGALQGGDHSGHAHVHLEEVRVRRTVSHDRAMIRHVLHAVTVAGGVRRIVLGIASASAPSALAHDPQPIVQHPPDAPHILVALVQIVSLRQGKVTIRSEAVNVRRDGIAVLVHSEHAKDGDLPRGRADHLPLLGVGIPRQGPSRDHVDVEPLEIQIREGRIPGGRGDRRA
mmetsp:Transcript_52124/g.156446  ORF Transcript_52124/g.156446 Transcript_52124/m.156446 type:complete len:262 (-) Transcript_52124:414-1199(-)